MYGVSRLHNLRELNLSYNGILTIEALKECLHLTHLNLEGNSIKTIEHLNTNLKLEYLNLGENSIGIISDISFLKQLKVSSSSNFIIILRFSLLVASH
jgi:centrosomal protein CEP97